MTYGRIAWIALVSAAVVVRGEEPATPHLTTTQATSTPTTSAPTTSASASASAPAATTSPATAAPAPDAPAASLEQATGRFEAALRKAREQYLRDLTELKRRAIRAENLAAANELNALIEQLDGSAGAGGPGGPGGPGVRLNRVTRAVVRADQDWQRTNILLRAGETIRVTASGEWVTNDREPALTTYGPDGLRRDGTADFHGMWSILWARIGYKVYFVGRGAQITAEQDGPLEFRSNDFSLGDNRGALTVQITKE